MEVEPPPQYEREASREGLPDEVRLMPWRDEVVETLGFGPRSMYVEMCWLPVLGPTTTFLYRRLGSWAEFNAEGTQVDMTDLAVSLGLGEGLAKHSGLAKAIERLVRFDAARWAGGDLQVRTALAPLPQRHVARLSYSGYRLHEEFTRKPNGALKGRLE